ncbi:hypothetical protein TRFO_01863 [Tritrichomonas foetus]|uniref:DUF3447 domain-containing protein n=1 Tax=Tritrichomonas foetus TaxID=1144522 RepID=A0A1J4JK92_9EUKA|nr:hypothetical protein TRFO_01863 [Tritrichomonas foetus]|eukprot:OHS98807.1 hypothetical protein TRFO_01863 [Tritrichomonas foetus]
MNYTEALKLCQDDFNHMELLQHKLWSLKYKGEFPDFYDYLLSLNQFETTESTSKFVCLLACISFAMPRKRKLFKSFYLFLYSKDLFENLDPCLGINIFEIRKSESNSADVHTKLKKLIKNDMITEFQDFLSNTNTSFNTRLYQNDIIDLQDEPTLIEFAALHQSIKIFRFMFLQLENLPPNISIYAIVGGSYEIIHLIEQKEKNLFDVQCLRYAIKYHRNDLVNYFLSTLLITFPHECLKEAINSNNFEIINKYVSQEEFVISCLTDARYIRKIEKKRYNISFEIFKSLLCVPIHDSEIFTDYKINNTAFLNMLKYHRSNSYDRKYLMFLVPAINSNNYKMIKTILDLNINPIDSSNNDINIMLLEGFQLSVTKNKIEIVKLFLDHPLYSKHRIINFNVPFHYTYGTANHETLKLLLKYPQLIDINDIQNHQIPLSYAYEHDLFDVFKLLLKYGKDRINVNYFINNESTVLHYACYDGKIAYVKALLSFAGTNINILNEDKQTPLHLAALSQKIEIVELLIKSGRCDTNLIDKNGVIFRIHKAAIHYLSPEDMIRVRKIINEIEFFIRLSNE